LQIKNYSQVKRVNGTSQGVFGAITCLIFSTKDGTQLAKVKTSAGTTFNKDFKVEDSEEIIGIYGGESDNYIFTLGFLVWQPPLF
jgi:hypothetical protein